MTTIEHTAPTVDWTPFLAGEALVCGLLGKLLYEYPDEAWLRSLVAEGVFDEAPFGADQPDTTAGLAQLQAWCQAQTDQGFKAAVDALRADYTRLFIGPGKTDTAPWESVQLTPERLMFQTQTLDVRGWYRRFGLEAVRQYQEPDDHVGLELAFLAHLAGLALQAQAENNPRELERLLGAQREFLKKHVLLWVPAWCRQVQANARTDFFAGAARLLHGTLRELAQRLEVPFPAEVREAA
jgi:TorA maturation chaperone TorD